MEDSISDSFKWARRLCYVGLTLSTLSLGTLIAISHRTQQPSLEAAVTQDIYAELDISKDLSPDMQGQSTSTALNDKNGVPLNPFYDSVGFPGAQYVVALDRNALRDVPC